MEYLLRVLEISKVISEHMELYEYLVRQIIPSIPIHPRGAAYGESFGVMLSYIPLPSPYREKHRVSLKEKEQYGSEGSMILFVRYIHKDTV